MLKIARIPLSCPLGGRPAILPARGGAWRAVAAAVFCAFAASVPASADTVLGTTTFTYTGGAQTYPVPAGTNYVVVKAWGAGGGAGVLTTGGGGAFVVATYNAIPGQQFTLYVGGAGQGYLSGGWPGGGSAQGLGGAGGGGYTRVITPMGEVWAGAGGGGGNGGSIGGTGGGGGPNGGGGGSAAGGGGASQSGGGGGGAGLSYGNGGGYAEGGAGGGDVYYTGGGGGGGYFGGGGGASGDANQSPPTGGGGGGGGSSVVTGSPSNSSYAAGGVYSPGGTGDPHYPGSAIGYGGTGVYGAGYPGAVVIIAYQYSIPPAITSSLTTRSYYLNQSASYTITASYSPTAFGAANLPPGLSVNAATGVISGTATAAGTYSSTISASNAYGTATATLVWNIFGPSGYTVSGVELDNIFEPIGTTTPGAGVGINSLGIDLAQRYRSSLWGATDQIAYDTGYQSGSTDLRYFFRRKGYVPATNPVATTFNYTGGTQAYTVPAGTQYVMIKVWGAGGGAGVNTPGGGGAFVTATYNASPGQQFTLYVGGAGQGFLSGGWPYGGSAQGTGGAGGGGYTRVITPMGEVWAGAGGGGGNGGSIGGNGGGGGGPNGGGGGSAAGGGGGGQSGGGGGGAGQSYGFSGGPSQGGAGGANISYVGGGGGAGYFGGGGGASGDANQSPPTGGGGGGGGSSFVSGSPTAYTYAAGGVYSPAGTGDPHYPGGAVGYGGGGVYGAGYPGAVVIIAYIMTNP